MNNSKKTAKLYENKTLTLKNNEKEQETAYVANQIENQTEHDVQKQKNATLFIYLMGMFEIDLQMFHINCPLLLTDSTCYQDLAFNLRKTRPHNVHFCPLFPGRNVHSAIMHISTQGIFKNL